MNTQTTNKGAQFITKTAQHTFLTAGDYFLKIVPFTYNETEYVAALEFKGDSAYVNIIEAYYYNCTSVNGKSYVNCDVRHRLFPPHSNRKSITTFKAMRELIVNVTEILTKNDPKEKFTLELVQNKLKGMELKTAA
jgi:hypothetical protein